MPKNIFLSIVFFMSICSSFALPPKDIIYRLTVSFNSIGAGVPSPTRLNAYVKDFKKSNKIKRIDACHIGPLGREGEYKLAFTLKELNTALQQKFIAGLKIILTEMHEKGSIELTENDVINMDSLPARTTIDPVSF